MTEELTPEEIAELDEMFGGRFPPDYQHEPISPEVDAYIRRNSTPQAVITDPIPSDEVCTGMDVPTVWTAEDVAFWTGTARYQPWKDVASFFRSQDQAFPRGGSPNSS